MQMIIYSHFIMACGLFFSITVKLHRIDLFFMLFILFCVIFSFVWFVILCFRLNANGGMLACLQKNKAKLLMLTK